MLERLWVASGESASGRERHEHTSRHDLRVPARDSLYGWRDIAEAPDEKSGDVAWLLRILRRNMWPILGAVFLALVAGFTFLSWVTPQFRGTAQIYIETSEQPIVDLSGRAQPIADTSLVDSQVEFIQSPQIAEDVLRAMASEGKPEQGTDHDPEQTGASEESEPTPAQVAEFSRNLSVKRIGNTNIIEVAVTDPDNHHAAAVVNQVLSAYLENQVSSKATALEQRRRALQDQAAVLEEEVKQIEAKIQSFEAQNNLAGLSPDTQVSRVIADHRQQLGAAQSQRDAISRRLALNLLSAAEQRRDAAIATGLPDEIGGNVVRPATEILPGTGSERLQAEVGELERKLLERQFEAATTKVKALENTLEKLYEMLADNQRRSIELAEMERQANAARAVYSSVLARLREAETQENLVVPTARIVFSARPAIKPSWPDKPITLLIFLAGGLALSAALVIWRESTARAFSSADDVEMTLGCRPAASLPHVRIARQSQKTNGPGNELDPASANSAARSDTLRLFSSERSTAAINYSQGLFLLKSSILPRFGSPCVAAITSPRSGDGKSCLTLNLGAYAVSAGHNTLVIDCNFRDPALSDALRQGANGRSGTSEQMDSRHNLLAIPTAYGFAFCNPAAGLPDMSPMDRLSASKLRDFIGSMREAYDLVLIDTPSLLDFVDARAIASLVDTVVLVLDWKRTRRSEVTRTLRIITESGGQNIVIVNNEPGTRRRRNGAGVPSV